MLSKHGNRLIYHFGAETLWIEPWGTNALRVRATKTNSMPSEDWALIKPLKPTADIDIVDNEASITNSEIKAVLSRRGKLIISNSKGKVLLEEYTRNRQDPLDPKCGAIEIEGREFKPIPGGSDYHLTARFESLDRHEKIYGMGQYQQPQLDLKGHDLELAHRNSQASVPFALSSLEYGFLWNNPAIGRAVFGKNMMSFEALSTRALDYWIVAGNSPAEIIEAYSCATGKVSMMPEYGLGFWQCKLRYQPQEELLEVAKEYKKRQLPIDLIVINFFHWPKQGDWKFDPEYWPNPDDMVKQLKAMNIELMVSIWPTVEKSSDSYQEMLEEGYLIRTDRGIRVGLDFQSNTIHFDPTNPSARSYIWEKAKSNYYSKRIKVFWLDEAEPEYAAYDFDNYRYYLGSNVTIGNIYPREYARAFYEGMEAAGQKNIVNLLRCAWAGSQKFGALVWSGDIASSWTSFRCQLSAGLNMGIAGLPWWTTDIGGFHGGNPNEIESHGNHNLTPEKLPVIFRRGMLTEGVALGGAACCSGAPNEVWSYGEDVYEVCKKYMAIRENMRDYTRQLMRDAHEKGTPIMRPCFYDFPEDERCWDIEEEYMYGEKYLCCPVFKLGQRKIKVYLPRGATWDSWLGEASYQGGQMIEVECPLDTMPVFVRH